MIIYYLCIQNDDEQFYVMKRFIYTTALFAICSMASVCASAQAIIKPAVNLFDKGKYAECAEALESVLSTNERDVKTNYYLGASYVMLNRNVSEGIRRLKFAQVKGFVGDSHFYLGRAYQLHYEFELAISSFDKFLKASRSAAMQELARQWREECQNSISLASKIFNIRVIDKYRVSPDSILYVYNPSREVGTIARNSSFFESDIDPEGILYRTERGDQVFFSTESGNKSRIYKMEKLLDGWGDMIPLSLGQMNNEKMPVMMTDGTTLYFASDRPGGMGGFDIYRTTYDIESRSFSDPVNLGVPFNSAFDDFLFVGDEFRSKAWFASNRETCSDSLMVYEILWDESVIRSFAQNTEEIRQVAALRIDPSLKKMRDDVTSVGVRKTTFSITKEEKLFEFHVNDSLTYTQWAHFRSEDALSMYRDAYAMQNKKDSLSAKMAEMRKEFRDINSDEKRNEIIADVMKIERITYNLEDQLDVKYDKIRQLENSYISNLVANGQYVSLAEVTAKSNAPKFDWNNLLKPENFEMYSVVPFHEAKKNLSLYKAIFDADEQAELVEADSLYAWAGILAVEAQKLTDEKQRTYLEQASAVLYSKAMDQKFDIFDDKYLSATDNDSDTDFTEMNVLRKSAVRDFSLVENVRITDGISQMQKACVIKKRGIASYTEAMERYASHLDGSFRLPLKSKSSEPVSVISSFVNADEHTAKRGDNIFTIEADAQKEIEKQVDEQQLEIKPAEVTTVVNKKVEAPKTNPVKPTPAEPIITKPAEPAMNVSAGDDATSPIFGPGKPVYRIQLGVFRNTPNADKLSIFNTVTTLVIPEKGLTKYYGGAYHTYAEAQTALAGASGFAGAFIVAFIDGKQVKVADAQKAE